MSEAFNDLWVEKYRPRMYGDIVMSDDNRTLFNKLTSTDSIPNLLFAGKPGIGKTSLAKILVHDILKCQYLYINASDENGIDTIRTKVTNFSKIRSVDGNIKVIILDEVDGLTIDAQRALRNTMEEYSQYVRFVLTANYYHKVIPPLQSRCQSFDLTPDVNGFYGRVEHVLKQEQIEYGDIEQIKPLIKKFYPDLRRTINELQKICVDNKLVEQKSHDTNEFIDNILYLVKHDKVFAARKFIIKKESDFGSDYQSLLRDLFDAVDSIDVEQHKKRECLLIVSEHLYRSAFVLDQEINFYSCLLSISKTI